MPPTPLPALASGHAAEWSPDGSQIAYAQSHADGSSRPLAMDVGGEWTSALTISALDDAPQWSPDGASLAFLRRAEDESTDLHLVQADGGATTTLVDNPAGVGVFAFDWSADGQWIAFVVQGERGAPASRHLVRFVTGEVLTVALSAEFHAPAWSPGANLIWWGRRALRSGRTDRQFDGHPAEAGTDRRFPDGQQLAVSAGAPIPG